jgi:hypothetical protein
MPYREDAESGAIIRYSYTDDANIRLAVAQPGRQDRYGTRAADESYAAFADALAAQIAGGTVFAPPSAGPAPLAYDASAAPAGSRVIVRIQTGEITVFSGAALSEPVILQDTGAYRLVLDVPEPHVGFSVDLELT